MDTTDSEFLKRIQATFQVEAVEQLTSFSAGLIDMEQTQPGEKLSGLIETLFRRVHSLKGAARSVGQQDIESVCHPLEGLFYALKKQEIGLNQELIGLFYKSHKILSGLVSTLSSVQSPATRQSIRDVISELKEARIEAKNKRTDPEHLNIPEITVENTPSVDVAMPEAQPDLIKSERQVFSQTVRIPISKLDPLLFQAEEFIQTKISVDQKTNELHRILAEVNEWKAASQKWSGRRGKATGAQWLEWQEDTDLRLSNLENHLARFTQTMEKVMYSFDILVTEHLDAMKKVLMLPVATIAEVFPAMVREISLDQQKDIDFHIRGAELEIDKRILEELKDPLTHLIRNSIDHGIGTPRERLLQNKPARGKITLEVTARDNGFAEINVSDDGNGVNLDQVREVAIKSGFLSKDSASGMEPDEIRGLIFESGFSTRSIITELSGRGLGLSIVREKVEKLNGKLSLETKENFGTTFRILLPMTLATLRGLVINLGEYQYIVPTMNVERVLRVKHEEITSVENHETVCVDDEVLSVVNLSVLLGLPESSPGFSAIQPAEANGAGHQRIMVLVSGETRIAFKIDEVIDECQILVKGLGKLLRRVRNISGATILGSGKVVPVLHIADLMKSAVRQSVKKKPIPEIGTATVKSGKILVAEDSITSRILLKNILETAGYQVVTAVDGLDAFTRAKAEVFDLVLSDVDMPRMNGFELATRIKSDKKLGDIPVILVTSLESRDDRERGIEAGADAYIIKSSFDQGNLLEVIRKFI
jgi:two-component system chemotaxis sensor kinase CheA